MPELVLVAELVLESESELVLGLGLELVLELLQIKQLGLVYQYLILE